MEKLSRDKKLNKLREELLVLERRLEKTLQKSNDAFNLGGDGWHDNSAYHLMIADVEKLGAMADQIKEEIKSLQRSEGKAVIVHGTRGKRDGNWFPYLGRQLSKLNFQVIRPQFPTPEGQTLSNWLKVWSREVGRIDSGAIFVGHSSAGAFLLRVLEKSRFPVKACFLVAPFTSDLENKDFDSLNRSFYKDGYDWEKVRQKCRNFFVYASDDDPYVPLNLSEGVADNLRTKMIVIKGAKHFSAETGFTKFPRLIKDITNLF